MPFCTKCGAQIPNVVAACPVCGAAVQAPPTPQNYQQAPQGYQQAPQGYQQAPQGFAQAPQGYEQAPQGYAQAPQGYEQAPQGYAQAPQGYAQAPQGYAQAPQGYAQTPPAFRPVGQLKTNRGLLKYILLSIVTFGIYGIVAMSSISSDINIIAGRYDGRKTMHYCLVVFIFSWLTFGIVPLVWFHKISGRIGDELERRGIRYDFGAGTFWLWNVLGSLIYVGPFIYTHRLFKSMNLLSESYNMYG